MSIAVKLHQIQIPKFKGEKFVKITFRGEFYFFLWLRLNVENIYLLTIMNTIPKIKLNWDDVNNRITI